MPSFRDTPATTRLAPHMTSSSTAGVSSSVADDTGATMPGASASSSSSKGGSKFGARFLQSEQEGKYVAIENSHEVFQYSWAVENPKAVLYISHGNTEHAARYRIMAKFLNKAGISVYGHDHLAHGKTAEREGCVLGDTMLPWDQIPKDLQTLCLQKVEEFSGGKNSTTAAKSARSSEDRVPVYLFGHSVGSVIAQKAIALDDGKLGHAVDGLILSGPVFRPGSFVQTVFSMLKHTLGPMFGQHGVHPRMETFERLVAFNEYQSDFKPNKTNFDWISREEKEIEDYIGENCGHNLSVHYWAGFFSAVGSVHEDDFSSLNSKPVLVTLGSEDPLARELIKPGGLKWRVLHQLMEEFQNCEELKILLHCHARHEPHNDRGKESVFQMISDWILNTAKLAGNNSSVAGRSKL